MPGSRASPGWFALLIAGAACALAPLAATAQMPGGVNCAGLRGEALDKCVRDATSPQIVPDMTAVEERPQPVAGVQCAHVLVADQAYCASRVEAIYECQTLRRSPNVKDCIKDVMRRAPKLGVADCSLEAPTLREQCVARNQHFEACSADPQSYFACLYRKATGTASGARPN